MVKRILALVTACLLMLALCGTALADRPMVVDEANLFSSDAVQSMEKVIQDIQKRYKMDALVLTTNLPVMADRQIIAHADKYYEDNGYGLGEDRAGVIVIIDMGNRFIYLSTAGVMIDYLRDEDIQDVVDAGYDYAQMGNYDQCAVKMLEAVRKDIANGVAEGHFRFDDVTGERLTGLYNKLTTSEMLLALLVGAVVALITVKVVSGQYSLKTVNTYQFNALTQAKCEFTAEREQFLRQTVTRTRNTPPPSSGGSSGGHSGGSSHRGGSGVHVSSGGMTHGGGGRHF